MGQRAEVVVAWLRAGGARAVGSAAVECAGAALRCRIVFAAAEGSRV